MTLRVSTFTGRGGIGQSEDIAGLALFLASPEASWITGRMIVADSGAS
jgi:3-oxoacyl-[acyl-carrier protein] reductase